MDRNVQFPLQVTLLQNDYVKPASEREKPVVDDRQNGELQLIAPAPPVGSHRG